MSTEKECEKEEDMTPGIFSWRELFSEDVAASQKFYIRVTRVDDRGHADASW